MPHATRRELVEHLTKAGFPLTLHGLNHVCAAGEGPTPSGVWAGRFYYDVDKAIAWARARFHDLSQRPGQQGSVIAVEKRGYRRQK